MILEDENSAFFNPKFSHAMERKPIEQWIISMGQHGGYISSENGSARKNFCSRLRSGITGPIAKI